jgi:ABC-type uncharacterized transport system auxiliary subunit
MDMSLIRNVGCWLCLFCLQACVQVLPDPAAPKAKYELDIVFQDTNKPRLSKTIVVDEPSSSLALNSRKIVVEQRNGVPHITYAQDQVWESRLPEALEQGLVMALKKTGGINGVAKANQGVFPDYIIASDINEFKVIYQSGQMKPTVEIDWQIKLLNVPERKIIAAKDFSVLKEAPENNFSAILKVFNLQTSKILHDISLWVRHHIDNDNKN